MTNELMLSKADAQNVELKAHIVHLESKVPRGVTINGGPKTSLALHDAGVVSKALVRVVNQIDNDFESKTLGFDIDWITLTDIIARFNRVTKQLRDSV